MENGKWRIGCRAILHSPFSILAVSFLALALLACGRKPSAERREQSTYGVDDFSDTIQIQVRPSRIVSLTPATTEILFALGASDRLVGRDMYSHWPDSALRVRNLGQGLRPNIEAVIAAKPGLVLLYASQDNRGASQQLRNAGIATASFKVDRIEQFDRLTRLLGRMIGDSARGALVADTVKRTLDSVRAATQNLPRVSVVLPTWDRPLIVIGGGSFMSQLVTIAGGRNIYDSIPAPSPIRANAQWRTLPAVRRGRVLVIDTSVTLRPAVRLGEGAVSLARLLHPELAR
jgi:ABC-type Fe3+-hydroxamate transport system substrate-binding protein